MELTVTQLKWLRSKTLTQIQTTETIKKALFLAMVKNWLIFLGFHWKLAQVLGWQFSRFWNSWINECVDKGRPSKFKVFLKRLVFLSFSVSIYYLCSKLYPWRILWILDMFNCSLHFPSLVMLLNLDNKFPTLLSGSVVLDSKLHLVTVVNSTQRFSHSWNHWRSVLKQREPGMEQ